jgi:putative ABC transport system permease protein
MNLSEIIRQSIESLLRNRLRSGLTMLGIIWGLVTVVLLLSYGKSLGEGVLNGFLGLGDNVIMVWGGQTSMQAGGERSGKRVKFLDGDTEAVRDEVPSSKPSAPRPTTASASSTAPRSSIFRARPSNFPTAECEN